MRRLAYRVRRAFRAPCSRAAFARAAFCLGGLLVGLGVWIRIGPIDPALLDLSTSASKVVVDRNGIPLYEALSGDGTRSVALASDSLPPALVAATVAAEDRRFWSHPGIDPIAIARAMRRNLAARQVVEGGSTITQQVAKLLLNRRSPQRRRGVAAKIREAVFAVRLEHRFSKFQILALYLNLASYGNQIVGAERASRAYFGKAARMLTPAQAAFLAALPQRPSRFNPYRSRDLAISRQRVVLRRMEAAGLLGADEARIARDERLSFAQESSPFLAPHFVEMVLAARSHDHARRIETTIDAGLQADIGGIIRSHRGQLHRHGAHNVAVVVLDNLRGEWLAWEGSGDYFDSSNGGAINGAITPRQPGSTLKPFTYALAFERGATPATVLPDIPAHFPTSQQGVLYSPRNYDGRYRGPLLARRALAGSENVPAVALVSHLGVPSLLRFLARAGLTTFDRNASYYGLGVTLGNAEARLDELVAAYSAFARGGEWIEPRWTPDAPADGRRGRLLVSPVVAYWISDILSDPDAREYIFGRGGSLEFPFPVAVKTGTSQAYHDNWTIGYTRRLTVGVWVGNFNRTPLRDSTGITGAGPIFHAVMLAATRRTSGSEQHVSTRAVVPRPDGLAERPICSLSGLAANKWCPSRTREWLMPDEEVPCSWHHQGEDGLLLVWPPEYRQWAASQGFEMNARPVATPVQRASARAAAPRPPIEIATPPSGATYSIDPTLRREFQTLGLRAIVARPGSVRWQINGETIGSTTSDTPLHWPLRPGSHHIVARDERGNTAESKIVVK